MIITAYLALAALYAAYTPQVTSAGRAGAFQLTQTARHGARDVERGIAENRRFGGENLGVKCHARRGAAALRPYYPSPTSIWNQT